MLQAVGTVTRVDPLFIRCDFLRGGGVVELGVGIKCLRRIPAPGTKILACFWEEPDDPSRRTLRQTARVLTQQEVEDLRDLPQDEIEAWAHSQPRPRPIGIGSSG
jgi:hypothetical protein